MEDALKLVVDRILAKDTDARRYAVASSRGAIATATTPLPALPREYGAFSVSLSELSAFFGDEYASYADDPYWLAAATAMVREQKMIEAGVIPPWFRHRARCKRCGPILLGFTAGLTDLVGCPWCFCSNLPKFHGGGNDETH